MFRASRPRSVSYVDWLGFTVAWLYVPSKARSSELLTRTAEVAAGRGRCDSRRARKPAVFRSRTAAGVTGCLSSRISMATCFSSLIRTSLRARSKVWSPWMRRNARARRANTHVIGSFCPLYFRPSKNGYSRYGEAFAVSRPREGFNWPAVVVDKGPLTPTASPTARLQCPVTSAEDPIGGRGSRIEPLSGSDRT